MAGKKKTDEEGGEKKKSMGQKLKPVLVIVAAAAGYKFFLAPKPATVAAPAEAVAAAAEKVEEGPVVTIPELVLNLAGPETHYLRVGAALVLEKGVDPKHFAEEELPHASDVLVDVLSEKTPEELKEPGSKAKLKDELSEKVREAYHDEKVVRVLFTSFVMQ
jgi:flagellar basal body-associated protein FliL